MPRPIPTVFRCLACGMMWVRPKSWARTRWGARAEGEHCSLLLTEFCNGTVVALQHCAELTNAALAVHRIGGDQAVTELAEGAMPDWQRLRVAIRYGDLLDHAAAGKAGT